MNKSIRTLAMLGLAGGIALAGSVRADDAAASGNTQDQIEDLRAELGTLTADMNNMKSMAKGMIEIHGFAETDVFNDTTGSFQEVVGNGAVKLYQPGLNYANDNGYTQESIRNSRVDFLAQKEVNGWKTKGYLEFDLLGYDPSPLYGNATATNVTSVTYYNCLTCTAAMTAVVKTSKSNAAPSASEAGFYTNATLRVRHAYLDAQNNGWEFMAGQYWTLLGWNMDYTLATVSVAPVMGVIYQRTPQVRVGYTLGDDMAKVQLAADAERPSSRESDMLNYSQGARVLFGGWQGQFATATGGSKSMPLSIGISGTEREYKWDGVTAAGSTPVTGNFSYDTWGKAVAIDGLVPVIPFDGKDSASMVLVGEWSAGSGYGDEFPSWSGGAGALNATTGNPDLDGGIGMLDLKNGKAGNDFTLLQIQSWNGQVQFHLPPSVGTFMTFGYGQIASPNVSDQLYYANGGSFGSIYNLDSAVFGNIMQDFGPNIRVALEWDSFMTHYAGAPVTATNTSAAGEYARDNRAQLSAWYRF